MNHQPSSGFRSKEAVQGLVKVRFQIDATVLVDKAQAHEAVQAPIFIGRPGKLLSQRQCFGCPPLLQQTHRALEVGMHSSHLIRPPVVSLPQSLESLSRHDPEADSACSVRTKLLFPRRTGCCPGRSIIFHPSRRRRACATCLASGLCTCLNGVPSHSNISSCEQAPIAPARSRTNSSIAASRIPDRPTWAIIPSPAD